MSGPCTFPTHYFAKEMGPCRCGSFLDVRHAEYCGKTRIVGEAKAPSPFTSADNALEINRAANAEARDYDGFRVQGNDGVTREMIAAPGPQQNFDAAKADKRIAVRDARIAELEAQVEALRPAETERAEAHARGERFETLFGKVRDERDDLLRENAVLRRRAEAAERKAAKR